MTLPPFLQRRNPAAPANPASGVDVSDIKHVIHFAPTGTLSDYIQEIGRIARDPKILGVAHVDYFDTDLHYVWTLNGISEMRQYQLKEMLKKLCAIQAAQKSRNLLIAAETFEYLFPNGDAENRTKAGLMLLAKDLSNKFSFPVLVVRLRAVCNGKSSDFGSFLSISS